MNSYEQARRLLSIVTRLLAERGQLDFAARLLEHVNEERVQEIIGDAAFAIANRYPGEFLDEIADQLSHCAAPVG